MSSKEKHIEFKVLDKRNQCEVAALFRSVFELSEGKDEGSLIEGLALKLSSEIDHHAIICLGAYLKDKLIGSIFLTQLMFKENVLVYMLAPVAVNTEYQNEGIGTSLINYGIKELKFRATDFVVTYGDPAFYSKVGFESLSEKVVRAPLSLSMPWGWLGQSLNERPIPVINDRPKCVEQFNDPLLW